MTENANSAAQTATRGKPGQSLLVIISTLSVIIGAASMLQQFITWHSVFAQVLDLYNAWIKLPIVGAFGALGINLPAWLPDTLVFYNGLVLALHQTHKWARGRYMVEPDDFKKFGAGTMLFVIVLLYLIMPPYFIFTAHRKESRDTLKIAFRYMALMVGILVLLVYLNSILADLPTAGISEVPAAAPSP